VKAKSVLQFLVQVHLAVLPLDAVTVPLKHVPTLMAYAALVAEEHGMEASVIHANAR
jgi:hypothetical protein